MLHEIIIKQNDAGQRLDKFCAKYMPAMPKNMLYKLIRQKDIRYNRKRCHGNEILKEGDMLHIYAKEEFFLKKGKKAERSFSSCQPLSILLEDENFLFLYKKAGQDVHSGGNLQTPSLIEQVQEYLIQKGDYSPAEEQSFTPALCNRIDRNTEGLVIAAKNAAALREMNKAIQLHQVKKLYLAVTSQPLPQIKDCCIAWLNKNASSNQVKISAVPKPSPWVKIMTEYQVIAQHGRKQLVLITLHTGRSHQIRAHLAFLGAPLLGDPKYGDGSGTESMQCLCAYTLDFTDVTSPLLAYLKAQKIQAPVPAFIQNYFPNVKL